MSVLVGFAIGSSAWTVCCAHTEPSCFRKGAVSDSRQREIRFRIQGISPSRWIIGASTVTPQHAGCGELADLVAGCFRFRQRILSAARENWI
ncbi:MULTISPECIES: hypothetical protein [unclassified Actinoplanes]|uniref:hypothetical protein n=1 Tax=unclassified Actinoplanes TaxID=2626549 RepID=UPI0012BAAE30|nr:MULTISPECIES: hypothetical protein [unclassified Actinoplanes]